MKKYILPLALLVLFTACKTRLTDSQKAELHIGQARHLIAENHLNAAKSELDSIHQLYPREVEMRRIAAHLSDTITCLESQRTIAYCDSLLPQKQQEKEALLKNFRFDKNETYQAEGRYTHRLLRTEQNASRSYLQVTVSEKAHLTLQSTYCGQAPVTHTYIELTANELSLSSQDGQANLHTFQTGGQHYETLTLEDEAALPLLAYIAGHTGDRLKVTLHGQRTYAYYLTPNERNALAETYRLAIVMGDIERLQRERHIAEMRINRIKEKQ